MDLKYKRILLKLSGEIFGGKAGRGFDYAVIHYGRGPNGIGQGGGIEFFYLNGMTGNFTFASMGIGPNGRGGISSIRLFSIGGVTHHGGQAGGCSPMRDIPRFVELLEKGQFDAKSLATTVVPLAQMLEAYEQVAARTTITALMTA